MKVTSSRSTSSNNRFSILPVDPILESDDTGNELENVTKPPSPPPSLRAKTKRKKKPVVPEEVFGKTTPQAIIQGLWKDRDRGYLRLKRWARPSRKREVSPELCTQIRDMTESEAFNVLHDLRNNEPQWVRGTNSNTMYVPTTIETLHSHQGFTVAGMVDSGATGCYISEGFAEKNNLELHALPRAIPVYNVDGTPNKSGPIRSTVNLRLRIKDHVEIFPFAVTDTGSADVIIGFNWLKKHNPVIDWQTSELEFSRCPPSCRSGAIRSVLEDEELELDDGDRLFAVLMPDDFAKEQIRATTSISADLAAKAAQGQKERTLEEMVPPQYLEKYRDVFEKKDWDQLPPRRIWDHAIELTPGAEPFKSKLYPLPLNEQEELDKMIEEHLATGRVRRSKSPMSSPFFFVKKKDGKLRPVQCQNHIPS